MYDWETIVLYLSQHRRWYENPARRPVDVPHLAAFRATMPDDWALWRRGYWLITEPPDHKPARQGWKLHVSASSRTSTEVLARALPVLRDSGARFKFLMDPTAVRDCNSKTFARGASGKFITIYPGDESQFRRLATDLTAALEDFTGPYILSDRRVPGSTSVYYRYGGFVSIFERQPSGLNSLMIETPTGERVPDIRNPYWSPPEWAVDPFPESAPKDQDDLTLDHGRFTVTEAITFSNRGGVYRGIDNETGADVVLREARPGVEVGRAGLDAIEVMRTEYETLRTLADTGPFVRPVTFFHQWEHAFLVEEFIEGTHLGRFTIINNPLYDLEFTGERLRQYYERVRGLWVQICDALAAAHERGIVLADISPTNILVDADDRIHIIDLESAFADGDDGPGLVTAGMANRRTRETTIANRRNDFYALGGIMLCTVMACHQTVEADPGIAPRLLDRLSADLGLPTEVVDLIRHLHDDTDEHDLDPAEVRRRIVELPFAGAWVEPVPLSRRASADDAYDPVRTSGLVDGVCRYLDTIADLNRVDRLFPADLMVFETNPLSLAHGAYGVLYALRRLRGDVPDRLLAWALQRPTSAEAMPAGLYYGQSGIAWALSDLGHSDLGTAVLRSARTNCLRFAEPGVLRGAAGYGMACLRLWRDTGAEEFLDDAVAAGEHLAGNATRDERGAHWDNEAGQTPIGYGAGAAGVAMFLLALHAATQDPDTLALGRAALDFDLSYCERLPSGLATFPGIVSAGDDVPNTLRHYWDEGTAGILTTVLRYHRVTGDPQLRTWIDDLLPDVTRPYTAFPQLFHGVAGLANVLLDAYEFLGEDRLLAAARRCVDGIAPFAIARGEGIVFPGEQTLRESADLATGSAGVALLLHRLDRARPGARTNFNFVLDDILDGAS